MTRRKLDRIPKFDERSRQYPIREVVKGRKLRSYTWNGAPHLDQGVEGACVGHGWAHEVAARPHPFPIVSADAFAIYHRARALDPWEGEDYEGTSVLAGAKAVSERGWVKEYRWAFDLNDALMALSHTGPLVVGFNWYEGMFEPDLDGYLRPTGKQEGGHCVMIKGINIKKGHVTVHNSWGHTWGWKGDALLSFADFEMLQHQDGEVCVPMVRR